MSDSYDNETIVTIPRKAFYIALLFICLTFTGCFVKGQMVDYVESHEVGYSFDSRTGRIHKINRTGYILHTPWFVEVNSIDLRPLQVCINANSRVLNCKLVRFNPAGLELFLSWHGRGDYSAVELEPILMSYAYEGTNHNYPFLTVIREMRTEEGTNILP